MRDVEQARWAWVASAARALRKNDSWTGRIHIQKLLFVAKALRLADPPFEFELYDYGPYSFGLDEDIANMELLGLLSRQYEKPGYGPRYLVTEEGRKLEESLEQARLAVINRVARALGDRTSKRLELLATCLWVETEEHLEEEGDVVSRVQELKPRYEPAEVHDAWRDTQSVKACLRPA